MIADISHHLTAESIWHTAADRTLTVQVASGYIVVRETDYGLTVYYTGGQYTAFTAADIVNHILWLLSDEFEAVNEAGDAIRPAATRWVSRPFLTMLITFGWLLALVAGMM
ncbi:MAG: hypothetical protein WC455_19030 [Dehalococcoidia bacterium]|jgi:hypothetical protein